MKNRVCEILEIEKPIIQAPMLWVTSAEMIAAVSESGGLGTYGVNGGYEDRVTSVEETAERTREQFKKIKSLTDKPFAFNYMISENGNVFSDATLKVAIEEGVKVVVAIGQAVESEIKKLKNHGLKVVFRELYPTIEGAKLAEKSGADIIVATGFDEGGTAPVNPIGTMSIVPIIVDAVDIPVMAAGGIADVRGVKASMVLGAEGVLVGTAFIASEECPASYETKKAILKCESTDTLTVRTLFGHERCLPTKLAVERYNNPVSGTPEDMQDHISKGFLNGFIKGELDNGFVSVNAAVSLIKEVKPCKMIIDDLFKNIEL
jgi:enoyl-[acyl-carrier protein] reductase II